jgi:hypothetical protein
LIVSLFSNLENTKVFQPSRGNLRKGIAPFNFIGAIMFSSTFGNLFVMFSFVIVLMVALVGESLYKIILRHEWAIRQAVWKLQFAMLSRVLAFVLWINRALDLVFGYKSQIKYEKSKQAVPLNSSQIIDL